jgi:hypothetical protein
VTSTARTRRPTLSTAIALVSILGLETLARAATVRTTGTAGKAAQHAFLTTSKRPPMKRRLALCRSTSIARFHRPFAPRTQSAIESEDASAASGSEALAPAISTQLSLSPVNSFAAVADNGTVIPPDTEGAVGPHHLMEALNSQIVIQDRSGKILSAITNWTFWSASRKPAIPRPAGISTRLTWVRQSIGLIIRRLGSTRAGSSCKPISSPSRATISSIR